MSAVAPRVGSSPPFRFGQSSEAQGRGFRLGPLRCTGHINGSALYRRALREEMELRDVDPDELRDLFERAREQGYTKNEIVEESNRYADLKALVDDAEE